MGRKESVEGFYEESMEKACEGKESEKAIF